MKKVKKLLALSMSLAMLAAAAGCTAKPAAEADATTAAAGDSLYIPGTYTAVGQGMGGDVTVSVTFSEDQILEIVVGDNNETDGIKETPIERIPAMIIEHQSLAVDAITGATLTSDAILEAVADCVTQAGGDAAALKNKKIELTAGEQIEKTADIIVIGGGGAGLSAAVAASDLGASVILIEKTAALGGNTILAGGPYNAADPERQAAVPAAGQAAMDGIQKLLDTPANNDLHQYYIDQLKEDLEVYNASDKTHLFDSVALHILQTYDGGDYVGDLELIEKLCTESLDTAHWLEDNGLVWQDEITTVAGGLWPRAHKPINNAGTDYINANRDRALANGTEIILECKANSLIFDNGKVTGVMAEMSDGTPVILNAEKNVILASGGFAANKEMRKLYNPSLIESLGTTNNPANVGDGITMAQEVGANLVGMEWIQCLPLGDPSTGGLNGWIGGEGVELYYQINKDGVRFMAEDGRRDVMTAALLEQEDAYSYVITDSKGVQPDGSTLWGDDVETLVENGTVFRADTIEELAEQIGIDPAVLVETHNNFNSYVQTGIDPEFGRTLFGEEILDTPFYASPRMPTVHHTMGGVQINLNGEVLDESGTPIPGLYAAGEVTGGIHGSNRLGGNALVDIHVFGKTAGENAAK